MNEELIAFSKTEFFVIRIEKFYYNSNKAIFYLRPKDEPEKMELVIEMMAKIIPRYLYDYPISIIKLEKLLEDFEVVSYQINTI